MELSQKDRFEIITISRGKDQTIALLKSGEALSLFLML
jgi:hypothetical protein